MDLKKSGQEVLIATQDKEVWRVADKYGIDILSANDLDSLLSEFIEPKKDTADTVQKNIVKYERQQFKDLILQVFTGLVTAFVSQIMYSNIEKVLDTINVWGTILLILIAGIALYVFREKNRLSYGVFEFLVGVAAIFMLFQPSDFSLSKLNFDLEFNIRLLGGLYIMVRGQDNIVKAIMDTKLGIKLKDKYGIGR